MNIIVHFRQSPLLLWAGRLMPRYQWLPKQDGGPARGRIQAIQNSKPGGRHPRAFHNCNKELLSTAKKTVTTARGARLGSYNA